MFDVPNLIYPNGESDCIVIGCKKKIGNLFWLGSRTTFLTIRTKLLINYRFKNHNIEQTLVVI